MIRIVVCNVVAIMAGILAVRFSGSLILGGIVTGATVVLALSLWKKK